MLQLKKKKRKATGLGVPKTCDSVFGNQPAYSLRQSVHLPGLAGSFCLTEAVVELQQQPLGEGLTRSVDASIVEDLGMLAADAHGVGRAAVQVGALALLPLQGHPAERCAACSRVETGDVNLTYRTFHCSVWLSNNKADSSSHLKLTVEVV